MSSFIDFAAVKEAVSFAQAIEFLDLRLKLAGNQFRGQCPVCKGDPRGLVVTPDRGFYCFSQRKGGDQIALAAHILDIQAKDAAAFLAEKAGLTRNSTNGKVPSRTVPESEAVGGSKLSPLSYLEPEHDMVHAIGFDPDFAERHGIGYAPRGVGRGWVLVPFRDEAGTLLGYIGVGADCWLPSDFKEKIVPLQKRA